MGRKKQWLEGIASSYMNKSLNLSRMSDNEMPRNPFF
jgi:hypothetical protein